MLVEVGKTYVNQAGSICKVVSRTDPPSCIGWGTFYSYFPLEDGKENREEAFHVDKYGSYLGELNGHDLVVEYKFPDFKWVWGPPDKSGILLEMLYWSNPRNQKTSSKRDSVVLPAV